MLSSQQILNQNTTTNATVKKFAGGGTEIESHDAG
jgi:hypothetical protein